MRNGTVVGNRGWLRGLGWLAASVLAVGSSAAEPADSHDVLDGVRSQTNAPAIAGVVMKEGKVLAIGVAGVRRAGAEEPASLQDRWPIGSCTKPMTRFIVARLADRAAVRLDSTLGELFDGVPMNGAYRRATLGEVLAHRAGIQPYTRIGPRITPELFNLAGTPREQRASFAAHVLSLDPVAEPGTRFEYSNAGYGLVAAAIERKTGRAWEDVASDELFVPLGLTSAAIGPGATAERIPAGHLKQNGGYEPAPRPWDVIPGMVPAGGVALSIEDFGKFAAVWAEIEGGRAAPGVSEATAKQFAEGGGQGFPGGPFFGGDGRYTAAFAFWPRAHLAIAVATNAGESDEVCASSIEALRAAYASELPRAGGERGPGGTAPGAADGPRFGFNIEDNNGDVSVGMVLPGSIADKAGLRAADRIVAVDGRPAAELRQEDWPGLAKRPRLQLTVEREGKRIDLVLEKSAGTPPK